VPAEPRFLPDLDELRSQFYADPQRLGEFVAVESRELPPYARRLLDHEHHMTVAMESFHGSPVRVHVLEVRRIPPYYSRKIVLHRTSDDRIVQFGLVRLNFDLLTPAVRQEIEAETTPLGRVLIQHHVLRQVHLGRLWRVSPGADLRAVLGLKDAEYLWGRTAMIDVDGQGAVELLEIVAPDEHSNAKS
jgi:chorismate-pyruvate lyase